MERFEEALNELDKAIKIKPNYLDFYYNKAIVLYMLNKYNEALQISVWLIENNSGSNARYYELEAESLSSLGRYAEALRAYDRAIQIDINNSKYYSSKAMVLGKMHRYEEAVMEYDKAIKLDPENSLYIHYRSVMLDRLNNDIF